MLRWVRKQLQAIGLHEWTVRKIELAAEEALVNIIQYAYRDQPGEVEIQMRHNPRTQEIEIVLQDQGPPFNPLHRRILMDRTAPLQDRGMGGLGIHFMRQYVDDISYERHQDRNVLTLKTRLTS